MMDIYVYTEEDVSDDELMKYANFQRGPVGGWSGDTRSYPVEDKARMLVAYLSINDDPDVPVALEQLANRTNKRLFRGVSLTFPSRSYEFAITVAAQLVRRWGGIADIDYSDEFTLTVARREGLPLLSDLLRDTGG